MGAPLFLKERQDAIAQDVQAQGRVTVSELAERFQVSEDCIRKDLKALADEGRCQRVYGGAIRVEEAPDRNIVHRLDVRTAQKQRVAEQAYGLIGDGETVFLDISTTNVALARLLAAGPKRCNVVSNMIDLLQILAANPAIRVLCPGGNVNLELNGFVGALTLETLAPMRFDKCFVGALGVDLESGGVLTFDVDDGLVKRAVLERSAGSYLVVDGQKFGAPGNYRFAAVSDFTAVVTDDDVSETVERRLAACGGRVLEA